MELRKQPMNSRDRQHTVKSWGALLLALLTFGCARSAKHLPAIADFDAERYTGRWHEIARFPHRFEKGLSEVTAEYSLRPDGKIDVVNRGYSEKKGKWKQARGVAKFADAENVGYLKVSFFGPFYGDYKILALDKKDYSYAVVASGTFDYLWILSRTPVMAESRLRNLIAAVKELGFETENLLMVDQRQNAQAAGMDTTVPEN
jgi:apolipoprotein D and lipocalin family protein